MARLRARATNMRRRFILSSFIAILTFAVGVSVDLLAYRFIPATVSLCQLAQHPDRYDGKLVRVKASASVFYGAVTIWDDSCKGMGEAAVVMREKSFESGAEVRSFLTDSGPEIREAEVLVIGRFDQDAPMGCFGPPVGIHASRIELRSPVIIKPTDERDQ